jgi:hypothetical protein
MSPAAWVFAGIVWLSIIAVVVTVLVLRRPAPKKPLERDALEATDAALRARIVDLEDKFEHYVKRETVRDSRARREVDGGQGNLPLDRAVRLQAARERGRSRGLGA